MNLLKTSLLSGFATLVRIFTGVIVTKFIAVILGPSGVAIIGQLQSLMNLVMLLAGDFLKTAVVKYTAEYGKIANEQHYKLWSSALEIILIFSLIVSAALFIFSKDLSLYFFKDSQFKIVLRILSFSLTFFTLNTFILSILNGLREIKKYILINILINIISLFFVCILSYFFSLKGALIAYATNQSIVLLITLLLVRNEKWFNYKNFIRKNIDRLSQYKKLLYFSIITFTAIASSNLSMVYIRNLLIDSLSTKEAGLWQALWVVSQLSMTLITTSLATYLLPALSSLKTKDLINKELINSLKLLLPVAVGTAVLMFILRDLIILVLYTKEFLAMRDLFLWQLVGNVVKLVGWLFGFVLVSRGMIKYTTSTELAFAFIWCLLTTVLVREYGIIGAIYAFAINSILYTITVFLIYRYKVI